MFSCGAEQKYTHEMKQINYFACHRIKDSFFLIFILVLNYFLMGLLTAVSSSPLLAAENRDTGGLALLLLLILKLARLACSPVREDILRRPPTAPPTAPPAPPPAPPVSEVRRGKAESPVADVILRSPPTAPPLTTTTPTGTVEEEGAPVSETMRRSPPTLLVCCGVVRRGASPLDSEGFLGSILLASIAEDEALATVAEVTAAPAALSCRDTENEARMSCSSSALRLCVSCSNVLYTARGIVFKLKMKSIC